MSYSDFTVRIFTALFVMLAAVSATADELTLSVQQQMQAQGAYSGPLDGNPSAEFTKALKAYQQKHNLPASGVIDRATAKALDDESGLALPAAASPAAPAEKSPSQPSSPPPAPSPAASAATPPKRSPPPLISPSPTSVPLTPSLTASPSAPATTPSVAPPPDFSPPSPGEGPSSAFTTERVTEFLRDFVRAGEGKMVTPQLAYYSFPVNYFSHGKVKEPFVRSEILRTIRQWPRRSYKLSGPVKVTPTGEKMVTADFTVAYTVQRGKQRSSGRRSNRVTLREINGDIKIVAIKAIHAAN
jgi:peptidoglycan hydrolase-like protein with peptidoglycan-binding domain